MVILSHNYASFNIRELSGVDVTSRSGGNDCDGNGMAANETTVYWKYRGIYNGSQP